ncbi:hypothetical protein KCU64_g12663, partial [Aureobasidium melanogenum]
MFQSSLLRKITAIVRSICNFNPSTSPPALDSKNQYVLALSPEHVRPMKDIRAAVDEKAQWRHSELLLLNKVKCLDTLETLDTMFADSIAGLQLVGHHLMIQHDKIANGSVVDPQSMRFLDERRDHPPSVLLAANHARRLTKRNYTSRFNMTEDQTRLLDISDCASRMLEASSGFLALQARCRELIALVQVEGDLPVGLQSTHVPTKRRLLEVARILGIAYEHLSRAITLLAGKTLGLSTFVSGSGYLGRLFIVAPGALVVETEAMEDQGRNEDDQCRVNAKEDNGLLETY